MNTSGLSLDQAPPFGVVLRFFLTAPLFGIAAGMLLLSGGAELLLSRHHPHTLALTHLITLGVMMMIMFGALFQMLPVIAGVVLPKARLLGALVHGALLLGTLFLVVGFLTHLSAAFWMGGGLLGIAIALFVAVALSGLWRVRYVGVTVQMMRLALIALAIAAALGVWLAFGHGLKNLGAHTLLLANLHAAWALAGWTALLILGVAQQVLPMFYVTPPYPRFCRRFTGPLILISLIAAAPLMMVGYEAITQIGVALGLLMLGGTTLLRIHQRKRKVSDASLRYWQLSMVSLLLSLPLGFIAHPLATGAAAVLFIGGFVLGLMNGMLYKIVPFLSWFHLSHTLQPDLPMMHDFVAKSAIYHQLTLHSTAIALLLGGLILPPLVPIGAALLIAAYGVLGAHLIRALRLYRHHGGAL